jgi:dolichol-phosphate mannosyltransferase
MRSHLPPGFGHAVRAGLDVYTGDAVAIMMADMSDSPKDLVLYYRVLEQGYDCAFGTRFGSGGHTYSYPRLKLVLNRMANAGIRFLFQHGYNDTTNAFKAYRRHVIDQIQPLLSNHFNLTVEMPLKAVVRGYDFAVVPVSWTNREHGASKLRLQEMGSRYVFIILYVWLERHLSRGDYRRKDAAIRSDPTPVHQRDLSSSSSVRGG